jgi:hypothetical protein
MKIFFTFSATALLYTSTIYAQQRQAPAYPLITHDPYFSIWSATDALNAATTTHWTGMPQPLNGILSVDGKLYSFLGKTEKYYNSKLLATNQINYTVQYTEAKPADGWEKADFNEDAWKSRTAPFGFDNAEGKTQLKINNTWIRRIFSLNKVGTNTILLKLNHSDNSEIYFNGQLIDKKAGWTDQYDYIPINKEFLKTGRNVVAIHLANLVIGSWVDVGLVEDTTNGSVVVDAKQKNLSFNATQTVYQFACGGVDLKVTFTSPLLMDDLNLLARPVSYISTKVNSNDSKTHQVKLYVSASSNIAVHNASQPVQAVAYSRNGLKILKASSVEQPILKRVGDNVRIDWGGMYVAVPQQENPIQSLSSETSALNILTANAHPLENDLTGVKINLNTVIPIGVVASKAVENYIMIGYDELFTVQYFQNNLRPWWNINGTETIENQFALAAKQYNAIMKKCREFDIKLYNDALKSGGVEYANLCKIAYRQAIAAHALTKSPEGEILFLSKENFSNGSINTVDVTYPSAPLFLIYNPDLLKGMLNGIFYYSESGLWKQPYAPHDLGTYPIANGQTYGGDMPVEESGNMLILTAAIAKAEGNAEYARKHWDVLTLWANYLNKEGFDPANQLSTDDFAGHLARNTNLSIKAITALSCYARLADMLGKKDVAIKYESAVKNMTPRWTSMADAGDHYALTFDRKDTWSQKYNLIWDKLLKLNIFPNEVYKKEVNYYLGKQNLYGLPLDSRETYTKSDWIIWSATLADNRKDFEALVAPVYKFAQETPDRVPLTDNHRTLTGKRRNYTARSVVGGYFIKMLEDKYEDLSRHHEKL